MDIALPSRSNSTMPNLRIVHIIPENSGSLAFLGIPNRRPQALIETMPRKMLSPSTIATVSPPMKSSPMMNACARPSGEG